MGFGSSKQAAAPAAGKNNSATKRAPGKNTPSSRNGNNNPGPSRITPRDKAILDLKVQRDKLVIYQKKLGTILERETEIAKAHLAAGNKKAALITLKKKKYQQTLLEKTDTQLLNLEQLTSSIEYALVEQQVLEGLKSGNSVLADIQNEMKIEDVERLMEETADAIAYQEEISQMLSGKLSEADEEDILEELRGLEEEEIKGIEVEMPSVPTVVKQPATVKSTAEETDQELEEEEQETEKRELVAA